MVRAIGLYFLPSFREPVDVKIGVWNFSAETNVWQWFDTPSLKKRFTESLEALQDNVLEWVWKSGGWQVEEWNGTLVLDSRNCTLKTKYSKASGVGGRKTPKTLSGIETKFGRLFLQFFEPENT